MLKVGDRAPDFTLSDQHGEPVRLKDQLPKHNVVLFFYPKDNTMICTKEACAFRDALPSISAAEAKVFGISTDPVNSHNAWAKRWQLGYPLLSDLDGAVAKAFDVGRTWGLFRGRVTYIIDKEGNIRGARDDPLSADAHIRAALATLQGHSTS